MLFHVESSPRGMRRPHAGQCETEQCMVKSSESKPCHSPHLGQITCTHYICLFICKMEKIIISTLLAMVKMM